MDQRAERRGTVALWALATLVTSLGTWVMYGARPGINWGLWTTAAGVCLLAFSRRTGHGTLVSVIVASVIAFGAAVTADPFISALICLAVILLVALAMILSTGLSLRDLAPRFIILAPIVAFATALAESVRRATQALTVIRSDRAQSVVRGIAITLPVIIVFALLLSSADPVFAIWRESFIELLETWEFLPRTIFFIGLMAIVLGAYGFAVKGEPAPIPSSRFLETPSQWLGSTEKLILLASTATLFWIFLAVQLSYLFGNLPQLGGSTMTFAEYARRGFGEITLVASATIVLLLFAERFGKNTDRRGVIRAVTLALILAVLLLLGSAFKRVLLYEQAYGFTTARLYAQAYMILVAITLGALLLELHAGLQTPRLFRRVMGTAAILFIGLVYWNHEAWIAGRNIDRYATTGRLDTGYLTRDLSPNALPTLVQRLSSLPEPTRSELITAIRLRYSGRHMRIFDDRWFEWNFRRTAALNALKSMPGTGQTGSISRYPP